MQRARIHHAIAWAALPLFISACAFAADVPPARKNPLKKSLKPTSALLNGFTEEELSQYSKRFQKDLWPLLTRNTNSCVSCHDDDSDSQLHMPDEADAGFKHLLVDGRFDPKNPESLFARIVTTDKKKKMPRPPSKAWTDAEAFLLRDFGNDLLKLQRKEGSNMDEQFPMELLTDYKGPPLQAGPDTTFITYYQLKRKVKAIFDDDWIRNGKDLFTENVAIFNGADFVHTFNESSVASATFLSGIDIMAGDIASRAYLTSSGPFKGRAATMASPQAMASPDEAYRKEINRLFNRILFRDATEREVKDAFKLIQNIYRDESLLAMQAKELRFELAVKEENGLASECDFMIPATRGVCGLYQEYIDENTTTGRQKLGREFNFKAKDENQQFQILNTNTIGNVSIASIELIGPLPEKTKTTIPANDPSVQILGAWTLKEGNGISSYEDQNENKGSSSLIIPIHVAKDGKYEMTMSWRKRENSPDKQKEKEKEKEKEKAKDKKGKPPPAPPPLNAANVLVEVYSYDPTLLALEAAKPVPPKGEAHFLIDQTLSNIPYWDLKTSFQFSAADSVEINNANTMRSVVADAVHFAIPKTKTKFMVKGIEAEGNEKWEEFNPGQFKPYNTFGPKLLTDNNAKKGELKLFYKPSIKKDEWKENEFYSVRISCPGKAGNETQTPVIVHAQKSSPVLQVRYPLHIQTGGTVTLDAAASYNTQHSKLTFNWTQTGGPRVEIPDPHSPTITFAAPAIGAQQAAWEGLCRALLRHPDFLFTRPPSVASEKNIAARQKLLLVKITQDLLGRTPNEDELQRLEKGAALGTFVDQFLESQEFKDFYFHRIRLVLESHGSDSDDEPTRLWSYIAFNDKPFKEILTADYTVDKKMQRQTRAAYYGKTGLLTMKGFIDGKPGLPHFNYPAIVCEKFLGYIFEVPASIVAMREGATAASTTSPESTCFSCHKILTPLAYQRTKFTDEGVFRDKDDKGKLVDATDHNLVPSYPFKGEGMEAFAVQAQNKERFIRTMIQTHFVFFFGREMRYEDSERVLYKRLWETANKSNFSIRALLRTMLTSPEYLEAQPASAAKS